MSETLQLCDFCFEMKPCTVCEFCDLALCAECKAENPQCISAPSNQQGSVCALPNLTTEN